MKNDITSAIIYIVGDCVIFNNGTSRATEYLDIEDIEEKTG